MAGLRLALGLGFGLGLGAPADAEGPQRPHVVVFVADDLGWTDLGCYGSEFYETPRLDALAREGLRFTAAYSAGSVCSPTRAALMTGKHPARVGITDWIPGAGDRDRPLATPDDLHQLPLGEVTLGEAFAEAGYATFYAGKWHLGGSEFGPDRQGFATYFDPHQNPAKGSPGRREDGGRPHATDELTRAALEFLDAHSSAAPVLLVLSYYDVHTPFVPEPSHLPRFQGKAELLGAAPAPLAEHDGLTRARQDDPEYASMVSAIDDSVGAVLDKLEALGAADRTVVVFTSDNGGLSTLRRPGPTCNLPLRAGKGWLYEGGIRVPLIVRAPGVTAGATSSFPATTADLYPTLLELAGLPLRPAQHADGLSLAGVLAGGEPPMRSTLFWHYPHYHGSTWKPGAAVRSGDWKLVEFYEPGRAELYNLAADPGETDDLADREPETAARLRDELAAWQEAVGAELPVRRE